jgi:hypothetical protein
MTRSPSRPHSRRWIWFFLVLALLSAVAIVVPIVYNLSIQLRPEQLAEARRLWAENAPANYDLAYLVKRTEHDNSPPRDQEYFVQIRAGRVVLVVEDGEVVYLDPRLAAVTGSAFLALSSEDAAAYGVPALFDQIEAMLPRDASLGRRDFATAQFDPRDGHPYHFVFRVRGTAERLEWNIKLTRIEPPPPAP